VAARPVRALVQRREQEPVLRERGQALRPAFPLAPAASPVSVRALRQTPPVCRLRVAARKMAQGQWPLRRARRKYKRIAVSLNFSRNE
jgi:hypothetical protein